MYIKKLKKYLKTARTQENILDQFKTTTALLDGIRHEDSWAVVLPELAEVLDE